MPKRLLFKCGDIVYIKCYLCFDYELGKIIKYDSDKKMYIMIHFLDNSDPESFWGWCYVKEDDIDFASKILNIKPYKDCFKKPTKLYPNKYVELYTEEYNFAKLVSERKMTKEEYYKKIWALNHKTNNIGT